MSKRSERLEAEEVYFVESDDDDVDNSDDNLYGNTNTQSKIASSNIKNNNVASSINKTEKIYSNRSELPRQTLSVQRTQTADDILFGDVFALQKRRMMASANKTNINNNNNNVATSTSEFQETAESAPNTETAVNVSSSLEIKQIWFAGGSPVAMPRSRLEEELPVPRSLSTLRGMTSLEVRVRLMSFFSEKEKWERAFAAALPQYTLDETNTHYTSNNSEIYIRECDRYARLVNIRNWSVHEHNAKDNNNNININRISKNSKNICFDDHEDDVLLPAQLVPMSSYYITSRQSSTTRDNNNNNSTNNDINSEIGDNVEQTNHLEQKQIEGNGKAVNEANNITTRTLRKHQIDGIRFLWNILVEGPVGEVPAVGCILAHTMGLGKTAQVIIFLHLFMCAFHHKSERSLNNDNKKKETREQYGNYFGRYDRASAAGKENKAKRPKEEPYELEEEEENEQRHQQHYNPQRVLIVVTKSTMAGWLDEFIRWSQFFPERHRLTPMTVENCNATQRIEKYYDWRRHGGILLIGYEALVKLLQLIEEDQVLHGVEIDAAFRLRQSTRVFSFRKGQPNYFSSRNNNMNNEDLNDYEDSTNHHDVNDVESENEGDQKDENSKNDRREDNISTSNNKIKSETNYLQTRLAKAARRSDEGSTAYGGQEDPFTELIVCDEVHRLKSVHLQVVQAIRGLHPLRRLLLTGTPLQNHLGEYWAMVDFALHKYFDRLRFRDFFVNPIESSIDRRASKSEIEMARKKTFTLITEVKHFVQRVDSTPLKEELPPLHEYIVIVPLSPLQRELYLQFLQLIQKYGGDGFQFLPAVSMAGKIAAHPQLVYSYRDKNKNITIGSNNSNNVIRNKEITSVQQQQQQQQQEEYNMSLEYNTKDVNNGNSEADPSSPLDEDEDEATQLSHLSFSTLPRFIQYEELCHPPSTNYVPSLRDGIKLYVAMQIIITAMRMNEKVLLFSLSTTLLDLFECMLRNVNEFANTHHLPRLIRHCRLDGSHTSAQRANTLSEFNKSTGPDLFLLSMKAGGLGITITSATRIILVDTSFNPADDQQAIGRAFRYGQLRPVFVYRLLCLHTLEYTIFEQKLAKEWLFKTIVEETSIKRDKLSGMHVKEVLALLHRSMRALRRPVILNAHQEQSTQQVFSEDSLLRQIDPSLIVYAQKYGMFLEYDHNEQYGEAERRFYDEFRRTGMFDVSEMDEAQRLQSSINAMKANEVRRVFQASQIEFHGRTLTDMVEELIRSRVHTDPHLYPLLTAMGLHIDEHTGRVLQTSASNNIYSIDNNYNNEYHHRQHQENSERGVKRQRALQESFLTSSSSSFPNITTTTSTTNKDDSDVNDVEVIVDVDHVGNQDINSNEKNKIELRGVQPLVDPRKYERYKPGASHELAIAIDDDEDEGEGHDSSGSAVIANNYNKSNINSGNTSNINNTERDKRKHT